MGNYFQQLVSRVRTLLVYNPYVFILVEYRPPGLYMSNIERPSLVPQHYHSQKLINELRAGDSRVTQAGWLLSTIWMLQHQIVSFQPLRQASIAPHMESAQNLLFGKPKPNRLSMFDSQHSSNSRLSLSLTHTNDGFDGLSRTTIQNAYSRIPSLSVESKDWQITAWSAAKHVHHAPEFGLDPANYGMTQQDLNNIAEKGLINHIREGGTRPNAKFVKAFQTRWKDFAEHRSVRDCGVQTVMGQDYHVLKHDGTRLFIAIKVDSEESYTGYILTKSQSGNHNDKGIIGKNYKN